MEKDLKTLKSIYRKARTNFFLFFGFLAFIFIFAFIIGGIYITSLQALLIIDILIIVGYIIAATVISILIIVNCFKLSNNIKNRTMLIALSFVGLFSFIIGYICLYIIVKNELKDFGNDVHDNAPSHHPSNYESNYGSTNGQHGFGNNDVYDFPPSKV